MSKNLLLIQNGFPGSATSGTVIETLDIKNFFKYEKDVVATLGKKRLFYSTWNSISGIPPFNNKSYYDDNLKIKMSEILETSMVPNYYEPETGSIKYNSNFKHYSISFLLFAVRMKKGFLGTDITITSRLTSDSPLKIRFYNLGKTVDDFKSKINKHSIYTSSSSSVNMVPHLCLSDSIVIPSVNQYNHCFLAALFSDSVYEMESGTTLLNNEPLLNISWTETEFTEAQ